MGVQDDNVINVAIGSTDKTSSDRSYSITINEEVSTVEAGIQYTMPASVTIPADSHIGNIPVTLNFDELSTEVKDTLAFSISGADVADFRYNYMMILSKSCTSELSGTYSYTSTNLVQGQSGDSCPDATGEVTWTEVEEGRYSTSDASFGQFGSCWNDGPATGIQFTHNCAEITVDPNTTDQYGDSYTYTIVSVSETEMVIDWSNTYGDGGRATITNPNGWPEVLQTN
ncbi:hypothetical protein [Mesonia sp. K7]|uniref:hypothetical protein n=1 Tax=Mesonia sp. K7 TaxID=2218606 RepID=UPI0011B60C0E|nr:hypothetical protein [Mesonia sp. K7]